MQEGNQYNNIGVHAHNVHLGNAYGPTGLKRECFSLTDILRSHRMTSKAQNKRLKTSFKFSS
jgi:hypothetical protein